MALTVKLAYTPTSPKAGQVVSINATPTGAASGATMSYAWTINGTVQSGTGSGITFTPAGAETDTIAVTATATGTDSTTETATDSVDIVSTLNTFPAITITVTPDKTTLLEGGTVNYTSDYTPKPNGSTNSYQWYENGVAVSGATNATYSKSYGTAGSVAVTLKVTLSMTNYTTAETLSSPVTITVTAPEYETDDVNYFHPLPQRESVFLQVGWWVMDEIQKAVADGVDWTEPDGTTLKYQKDLLTVAKIIADFPNVEVQESRNGWILGADRIKSGKIYTW